MTTAQILKECKEVGVVRADKKHRVSLGRVEIPPQATSFKIYAHSSGLIVMDPQVTIPAREAWLYKDKEALKTVQAGLEDLKAGRIKKSKE